MKIQINQDISGLGPISWELHTGPEHIDVFSGKEDTLAECFIEIEKSFRLNNLSYIDLDSIVENIAINHFPGVETLNTRKSDDLDFHDVSVWSIKSALREAFVEGTCLEFKNKNY